MSLQMIRKATGEQLASVDPLVNSSVVIVGLVRPIISKRIKENGVHNKSEYSDTVAL